MSEPTTILEAAARDAALGISELEICNKYRLIPTDFERWRTLPEFSNAVRSFSMDPSIINLSGQIEQCRIEYTQLINHSNDAVKTAVIQSIANLHHHYYNP